MRKLKQEFSRLTNLNGLGMPEISGDMSPLQGQYPMACQCSNWLGKSTIETVENPSCLFSNNMCFWFS